MQLRKRGRHWRNLSRLLSRTKHSMKSMLNAANIRGPKFDAASAQRWLLGHGGQLKPIISGEPFLTPPGEFSDIIAGAVREVIGIEPELSTSGGTSDARFLAKIMPVVEFGLCNATMHKLDEAVATDDLEKLVQIYALIVERALV